MSLLSVRVSTTPSRAHRLGFHDVVMLWIKVDVGRAKDVLTLLARESSVRYLSRVAGAADIVAEVLSVVC